MKSFTPCSMSRFATWSVPNPLAMALRSMMVPEFSLCIRPLPRVIPLYPTKALRLSTCASVGNCPFLKPNPHALTSGATVMSKAPSVASDTLCAMGSISVRYASRVSVSPRLMREMVLLGLNMDREASTPLRHVMMVSCRSSVWVYVAFMTVPKMRSENFHVFALGALVSLVMATYMVPIIRNISNAICLFFSFMFLVVLFSVLIPLMSS